MVAASVVTTILVLNYHHRQEDTHEMPDWVGIGNEQNKLLMCSVGSADIPSMDSLGSLHVSSW